ncbi:MAG TPA: glycosyltransferase family 2 protein [Terriglobia bacterium]|nr:glycosyltransferase family 2 protein [Terriglobia bacterium]
MSTPALAAATHVGDHGVPHPARAEHICVCICTYKRPQLLRRLLESLNSQITDGLFTYSIVVVDNDKQRSAEAEVSGFAARSPIRISFCAEPEQNIPMARNRAVANASGDYVAFIDDDEFAAEDWLLNLLRACHQYHVAGVVGPVNRYFDEQPPKWIEKGQFWQRPSYATGLMIAGTQGRVNNALLRKGVFAGQPEPFRREFRAGEDKDFFTRMVEAGHSFVWCREAVVYEIVPPTRWKRSFILKRSLLQGSLNRLQQNFGMSELAKSLIALPAYAVLLPFAALAGHHRFMSLMVKLAWHAGHVLSFMGIQVIKDPYVTG